MNFDLNTHIKKRFGEAGKLDDKVLFLIQSALSASIASAVRRNPYNPPAGKSLLHWKICLIEHTRNIPDTIDGLVEDVDYLRSELIDSYEGASLRLSHAQKSLSVFIKYLWCYDIVSIPPACPLDRTVLSNIKDCSIKKWTELDNKEDYRSILHSLEQLSKPKELAIKELIDWNKNK